MTTPTLSKKVPNPIEPSRSSARRVVAVVASISLLLAAKAVGESETVRVDLTLVSGGALSGLVVDHNEGAVVVVRDRTPYVFAWDEIEAGSAYRAKRALLELQRKGADNLTAGDHFELAVFALSRGRAVVARNEFRRAIELDEAYQILRENAIERHRKRRASSKRYVPPLQHSTDSPAEESKDAADIVQRPGLNDLLASELGEFGKAGFTAPSAQLRGKVRDVYERFGRTVKEVMGESVVLLETDHFLIYSDVDKRTRELLGEWCEAMYDALCGVFGLDPQQDIFLSKCPVFCWRSKGRFLRFAGVFDGYKDKDAVGYTRSIEKSGHVHIALFLDGRRRDDLDRFVCTLVHEGTHAFLHRFYTSRLIPHWVNEGYADLTTERVLGDRCPSGEKARLLAEQYARYNWSIGDLMGSAAPITVHQYPLAHSIVEYLESLGRERFVAFVKGLKEGAGVAQSLGDNYDGLRVAQLEAGWRSWVLDGDRRAAVLP